ncbi:MAG: serine/threonine protein kinase [Myxococcales bacterium]|nr:serine/threonine protein kinase [Myxococcales bacterium]
MTDQDKASAIDRFDVRTRLGAGAMGVVFEAYDRERDRVVALKTLPNAEANALYRFKREFRTLADISHPNLVNLYELFIEPESCFFTMEKVDGTNFLAYVRPESEIGDLETLAGWASHLEAPSALADTADEADNAIEDATDPAGEDGTIAASSAGAPLPAPPTARHPALAGLLAKAAAKATPAPRFQPPGRIGDDARNTATSTSLADVDTEPGSSPRRPILEDLELTDDGEKSGSTRADQPVRDPTVAGPLNLARLRVALRQLANGVAAIHDAGKLHRDLKPSNVMVTDEGRVVILDFGLATELAAADGGEGLTGTAAYMAPEQVEGQALPASDWYAIGVMLFEALTGRRPFTGSLIQVLMDKRKLDAPRPDQFAPDVPADLAELCARLLARDPEARPKADEILATLGASERPVARVVAAELGEHLVGRERQIADLRDAAARAAAGDAVAA